MTNNELMNHLKSVQIEREENYEEYKEKELKLNKYINGIKRVVKYKHLKVLRNYHMSLLNTVGEQLNIISMYMKDDFTLDVSEGFEDTDQLYLIRWDFDECKLIVKLEYPERGFDENYYLLDKIISDFFEGHEDCIVYKSLDNMPILEGEVL